jgi:prevent-host-death family protein
MRFVAMSESTVSLSEFRAEASRLLDDMQEQPGVLVITQNGRARAVVQDYVRYQEEQRALVMLKLMLQGEADVAAGRLQPQIEVFADLRDRLTGNASAGG